MQQNWDQYGKKSLGESCYLGGDWSGEREAKAQQKGRSRSEKRDSKLWESCSRRCLRLSVRQPYAWSLQPETANAWSLFWQTTHIKPASPVRGTRVGRVLSMATRGAAKRDGSSNLVSLYWCPFQAGQHQQLLSTHNNLPTSYSPEHWSQIQMKAVLFVSDNKNTSAN